MRYATPLIIALLFLSACKPSGDASRMRLERMFEIAKNDQCSELSHYILYNGRNMRRNYRDTLHIADSSERAYATKICDFLNKAQSGAKKLYYAKFYNAYKQGLDRYVWEVLAEKSDGIYKYGFSFTPLDSTYYLIEVH